MKSSPRRTAEAAKPARSPITPPPSATTRSLRSMRAAISASQTRSNSEILLRAFAGRHRDVRHADAGGFQRLSARRQDAQRHILVGDDRGPRARPQSRHARAELREHAAADDDVIGAVAERDVDHDRIVGTQRRGHDPVSMPTFISTRISIENLLDNDLVQHFARLDRDVGLRVNRIAHIHQLLQRRGRIGGFQHRAIGAALDAFHQHVELGLEPDRDGLGADERTRIGIHIGAAAGRQHLRSAVEQARDHARLAGAELGLAARLENIRDRHAGRFFDLGVGIDKGQPEPGAELAADRRLARAHHPDKHDRAAAERCDERAVLRRGGHFVVQRGVRHGKFRSQILRTASSAKAATSLNMPTLFRFLAVVGIIGGLVYAGIIALATMGEPQPREITVTVPQDRFYKQRNEPRRRQPDGPRGEKLRRRPDRAVPRHARGRTRRARKYARRLYARS